MILAETVQQLNSHMVWDFILLIIFIWACVAVIIVTCGRR
jgi:hypothetical protein